MRLSVLKYTILYIDHCYIQSIGQRFQLEFSAIHKLPGWIVLFVKKSQLQQQQKKNTIQVHAL